MLLSLGWTRLSERRTLQPLRARLVPPKLLLLRGLRSSGLLLHHLLPLLLLGSGLRFPRLLPRSCRSHPVLLFDHRSLLLLPDGSLGWLTPFLLLLLLLNTLLLLLNTLLLNTLLLLLLNTLLLLQNTLLLLLLNTLLLLLLNGNLWWFPLQSLLFPLLLAHLLLLRVSGGIGLNSRRALLLTFRLELLSHLLAQLLLLSGLLRLAINHRRFISTLSAILANPYLVGRICLGQAIRTTISYDLTGVVYLELVLLLFPRHRLDAERLREIGLG